MESKEFQRGNPQKKNSKKKKKKKKTNPLLSPQPIWCYLCNKLCVENEKFKGFQVCFICVLSFLFFQFSLIFFCFLSLFPFLPQPPLFPPPLLPTVQKLCHDRPQKLCIECTKELWVGRGRKPVKTR